MKGSRVLVGVLFLPGGVREVYRPALPLTAGVLLLVGAGLLASVRRRRS